jgi:4-amino-4-deoxy-L-arabinose transferase-like glycosyltransferase
MARERALFIALALVIVLIAGFLRIRGLADNPPGMFRDELEKGWSALSIWETGRTAVISNEGIAPSNPAPVFIDVFGDKTSAIYQYIDAPFVGAFGLSRGTTRAAAALSGVLAVIALGALGWLLFGAEGALWCGAAAAVLPHAIIFSRWAQQGGTVPLFAAGGVACFWAAFWRPVGERRALAGIAGVLLAVAFYAYDPVRPGIAALLVVLVASFGWERIKEHRRALVLFAFAFLAIAVPITIYALGAEGSFRFRRVSVFSDGLVPGLMRAASNYAKHFSPDFLFLSGDHNARHGLPGLGLMSIPFVPLILAGLWACGRDLLGESEPESRARAALVLAWVLAAPLGAAFTRDGIPHALRSILFVPALVLLVGQGAYFLAQIADENRRRAARLIAGSLLIAGMFLANGGVSRMREHRPDAWQAGVLERLEEAYRILPSGPVFIGSDVPYAPYFILFYERTKPADFQKNGWDALRTRILPAASTADALPEGAILVALDPSHPVFAETEPMPVLMTRSPDGQFVVLPEGIAR